LKIVFINPESFKLYDEPVPGFIERLRKVVKIDCEIVYPKTSSEEELIELAKDADIIVRGMGSSVPQKVLDAAYKVKLIQTTGAGVEKMPFAYLKKRGIYLANTSGANAVAVAEHAFALILAIAKKVITRHVLLKQGVWERSRSIQLLGKTLGIVGLGDIGIELTKRARAFNMLVIAIKRHPSPDLAKKLGLNFLGGPNDLHKILKKSDFLVLSVPSTPETGGLIGEKELRLMKSTAFIINVARGGVIQEDALYKALTEKWIAGAGIDTWWDFDPNTPSKIGIHKLDNIVITSHVGGSTIDFINNVIKVLAENIERIYRNETPLNEVDLNLRY